MTFILTDDIPCNCFSKTRVDCYRWKWKPPHRFRILRFPNIKTVKRRANGIFSSNCRPLRISTSYHCCRLISTTTFLKLKFHFQNLTFSLVQSVYTLEGNTWADLSRICRIWPKKSEFMSSRESMRLRFWYVFLNKDNVLIGWNSKLRNKIT